MKPMLASPAPANVVLPAFISPKIDGVRAIIKDGIVFSRALKPIPNGYVQDQFGREQFEGLDGELCVGDSCAPDLMQKTTSGVMSRDGEPDVHFWVFDYYTWPDRPYHERNAHLHAFLGPAVYSRVHYLPQSLIHTYEELEQYEAECLDMGYEGAMLRSTHGIYKYGRSTAREGHLLKIKRFVDAEAVVIGVEEFMHNANEPMRDQLGFQTRSSHKANLVPMNMLGALVVRNAEGVEFKIGTGYDMAARMELWSRRSTLIGATVTYKTFAATGVKDKPRFPVFKAFRDTRDMG